MKTKTIETIGRIAAFLRGGAVAFLVMLAASAIAVWAAEGNAAAVSFGVAAVVAVAASCDRDATAVAATGRSVASAGGGVCVAGRSVASVWRCAAPVG